jgi:oligopeptide/dipeptide ABC transporter ATP-binding protein
MKPGIKNGAEPSEVLLAVENLRVHFRGEGEIARAVDGVDFEVHRGETVCLVGESGCGKTVSALAVMGLLPVPPAEVASGRARFDGTDLLALGEAQLQRVRGRRIGMVFQEPMTSLNPVLTIGEQIAETLEVHAAAERHSIRQRCIALLEDVGIASPAERLGDYPHQLSGGQRQRVMIAIALACSPALLIADEPTTALDVTVQAQILGLLDRLRRQRDMSVLYITHDLGVVARIADRVYVMYAGVIVEQSGAKALFGNPRHPYTRALLAALPSREKRGRPLYSIPGSVPHPAYKPPGCPFHPRCPLAEAACRVAFPAMVRFAAGHEARCPVVAAQPARTAGGQAP